MYKRLTRNNWKGHYLLMGNPGGGVINFGWDTQVKSLPPRVGNSEMSWKLWMVPKHLLWFVFYHLQAICHWFYLGGPHVYWDWLYLITTYNSVYSCIIASLEQIFKSDFTVISSLNQFSLKLFSNWLHLCVC